MENQDTVYLYSNEQAPLYSDVLGELEARNCPHTNTVYALMDVEESEVPNNMVKHVSTCRECQKTVMLSQAVTARINSLIPEFQGTIPDTLFKNNKEMFFKNEFSTVSKTRDGALGFFKELGNMAVDMASVLFSVKMGMAYVAAIFFALFVNWIS
ncbi:MAG: hypothetical protein CME70_04855 [Halobacteriovorax sp.]|nr:hypothetical protein [Halobacteriovorax sp.]|tara:strand:+ start:30590 stop:31054 length:465 start_codon:yes stop_codon:yes gene_type:complete